MHPLGVFYDKANEGAGYQDGKSGNDTADDAIMPNQTFLYRWTVPEAVAPTTKILHVSHGCIIQVLIQLKTYIVVG